MMLQARYVWVLFAALLLVACGSDRDKKDPSTSGDECPEGQRWNPILDRCTEDRLPTSNNTTANSTDNNSSANSTDNNANNTTPGNNSNANNTTPVNNNTVPVNNSMIECGLGSLIGKTCAPSGEPLASADVTLTGTDCNTGMPFELTTRAASDGTYEFTDVPAGRHSLRVTIGSFDSMSEVVVRANEVTDLTTAAEKVCLDQNVKIAVIEGSYDHVEGILDQLNLEYDVVGGDAVDTYTASATFLTDINAMNEYDIVFINCGELYQRLQSYFLVFDGSLAEVSNNLRTFVQGGKSLYVADWSAPFLEGAFPDAVDFLGDDTDIQQARDGYAAQQIAANVLTPELQAVLGRNTATIDFPQDPMNDIINNNWAVAEGVGMGATTQLQGDADLCADSSFPMPACSEVDGTQPDVPLLVTYKDPSGGTAVFTSFHNERQVTLNQDMDKILRFLIFQL